uniref:Aromatic-L-amino-acid decarboxylase n=1 Tax=Caenorhabditis japonica TaxID=281687 RepID=A0A8R1HZL8_CAEJA
MDRYRKCVSVLFAPLFFFPIALSPFSFPLWEPQRLRLFSISDMDSQKLRTDGKRMLDFVADYWDGIRERRPLPDVKPGYIRDLVPTTAPTSPEDWTKIFDDLENVVINGATHWHHPHFFAYFPTALSYQSIMADILSGGIAGIGFTWKSCPSMTELEMSSLDWVVDLMGLPEHFKNSHDGPGCGIIQSTASDSTMVAIMAARATKVEQIKAEPTFMKWVGETGVGRTLKGILDRVKTNTTDDEAAGIISPHFHDPTVFERFVMYCSDQAHSSVEKGAMLSAIRLRKLKSTRGFLGNYSVTGQTLRDAIKEDRERGYVPFMFLATVGTTCSCGVDQVDELGPICAAEGLYIHVDAAYAGTFALCDEFKYLTRGMEHVDSYNFNLHKAGMVNFDCSPMWFKNGTHVSRFFNVDALYLAHEYQSTAADYRSTNADNEKLCNAINEDRRIHLVPSTVHGTYFLRMVVCSQLTTLDDVIFAKNVICQIADRLF